MPPPVLIPGKYFISNRDVTMHGDSKNGFLSSPLFEIVAENLQKLTNMLTHCFCLMPLYTMYHLLLLFYSI